MNFASSRLAFLLPLVAGCNLVLGLGDYKEGVGGAGGASHPLTCGNGKRDGSETDLDCGGDCEACDPGKGCTTAADCTTKVCSTQGACAAPSCTDGVRNGDEASVDCG